MWQRLRNWLAPAEGNDAALHDVDVEHPQTTMQPSHVFTQDDARLFIYTDTEGPARTAGHRIKFQAQKFALYANASEGDQAVRVRRAEVDVGSLSVVGARDENKKDIPNGGLSKWEKSCILSRTIGKDVLDTAKFPLVSLDVTRETEVAVEGDLRLHGQQRRIVCSKRIVPPEAPSNVASSSLNSPYLSVYCTVHQPDFGIAPFSIFCGSLRVAPDVGIEVQVPLNGGQRRQYFV